MKQVPIQYLFKVVSPISSNSLLPVMIHKVRHTARMQQEHGSENSYPPTSHMFRVYPRCSKLLILNPTVGLICSNNYNMRISMPAGIQRQMSSSAQEQKYKLSSNKFMKIKTHFMNVFPVKLLQYSGFPRIILRNIIAQ